MFPLLHQDVVEAVSERLKFTWFSDNKDDDERNNGYTTHVMGKFKRTNSACSAKRLGQ